MEFNQWKKNLQDFAKSVEAMVEKGLGEKSQFEGQQVRHYAKQVEKTLSEVVWNRNGVLERVSVKVCRLPNFSGELPKYETLLASGFDVRAQLEEPLTVAPNERVLIPTGLSFEIPRGYEIQVRARSGLAIRSGVGIVNAPGTIDADYRGEVKVILINWGNEEIKIQNQDRIAQFVVCPVVQADMIPVEDLNGTARGAGGFGSTGK